MKQTDRDYFARIATAKTRSADLANVEQAALTVAERLALGLRLSRMAQSLGSPTPEDDPSPFYARARARGLYRP